MIKVLPPASNPIHSEDNGGDHRSVSDPRRFQTMIEQGTERIFRVMSYLIWTCLALGLTATICPTDFWQFVLLNTAVAILAVCFWLYVVSLFLTPPLHILFSRFERLQQSRLARFGSRLLLVVIAIVCGFIVPIDQIIDAYVLKLFPTAAACEGYF